MIACLFVALAHAEGRMGFMLQLYDPAGYIQDTPQVNLKGTDGTMRRLDPADDGGGPDFKAGDNIYTSPVPSFTDASATVEVTAGSRTWRAEINIPDDEKALVRLRLDDGVMVAIGDVAMAPPSRSPAAAPVAAPTPPPPASGTTMGTGSGAGPTPGTDAPAERGATGGGEPRGGNGGPPGSNTGGPAPTATDGPGATATEDDLGAGILVWGGVLVAFAAAAGVASALQTRPGAGAPLGAKPPVRQAPRRLAAADVAAVLRVPLAPYRVVVLGDPLPETIACLERAPLPEELVTAIERLATTPGDPPALLVTDASRLDHPHPGDPVAALAARIGGYFPLYVVNGPASWQSWTPERPPTPR